MLLDEPASAARDQGTGWFIANAPEVIGPDGKPQSTWLDRRVNKQQTNLNFILVRRHAADPAKDAALRVCPMCCKPLDPWRIPDDRAFICGTAEANEMKSGKYEEPPGGNGAPSGRLRFSNTVKVRVQ